LKFFTAELKKAALPATRGGPPNNKLSWDLVGAGMAVQRFSPRLHDWAQNALQFIFGK